MRILFLTHFKIGEGPDAVKCELVKGEGMRNAYTYKRASEDDEGYTPHSEGLGGHTTCSDEEIMRHGKQVR